MYLVCPHTLSAQVLDWISSVGLPTLHQEPEVADCLSQAEILRNHFHTGFYSVAQVSTCALFARIVSRQTCVFVHSFAMADKNEDPT